MRGVVYDGNDYQVVDDLSVKEPGPGEVVVEIAAAGLFGCEGIILGRRGRRYLMLAGQQGVSLAAPPRTGPQVAR